MIEPTYNSRRKRPWAPEIFARTAAVVSTTTITNCYGAISDLPRRAVPSSKHLPAHPSALPSNGTTPRKVSGGSLWRRVLACKRGWAQRDRAERADQAVVFLVLEQDTATPDVLGSKGLSPMRQGHRLSPPVHARGRPWTPAFAGVTKN